MSGLNNLGMYRGYKNRNAHLDKLDKSPPRFLAESRIPLANQDFKDIYTLSVSCMRFMIICR